LDAFANGKDLHTIMGSAYSGIDYDDLMQRIKDGDSEAKSIRQIGKTANFSLVYGVGPSKLRKFILVNNHANLSQGEAERLIEEYDRTYSGAKEWKKQVVKDLKSTGYVTTLTGRRRRLPGIHSEERWEKMQAERQGINAKIQGSCGDIMCYVMIPIQAALKSINGSLLVQVHDELVAEVPEYHADLAAKIIKDIMEGAFSSQLRCPLVADTHIGVSWGGAKSG
jgi:DNA polymerase I